jgi:trigger factor
MKIEIKKLPHSQKELEIEVTFLEFKPFLDKAVEELKKNIQIEGFRKGKVPSEIAQKKLKKEEILTKGAEIAIKEFYSKAVKEKGLEVIGQPEIKILKLAWDSPLKFRVKTWVLPEIELPDYKKIASQVEKREVPVDDKEIEETIKWLQKSRAKIVPKNTPCKNGDFIEISYSSPSINQGKETEDRFVLGEGHLVPDFEKNLIGMKEGEEKKFSVLFPKDYARKELAEKSIEFKVKVTKVHQIELPEINDQWAQSLGKFENLAQLKKSIKEGILKEKEEIEKQRVQAEILEKIAQKTICEIPKVLIDIELEKTVQDLKERIPQILQMSFGEYLDKIKKTEAEFAASLLPEIEAKIKKFLVLREIRKRENIEASEEEIEEEANKFLSRFKTPEEAEEVIDPESLREYTKERIENQKTLEFLESLAK